MNIFSNAYLDISYKFSVKKFICLMYIQIYHSNSQRKSSGQVFSMVYHICFMAPNHSLFQKNLLALSHRLTHKLINRSKYKITFFAFFFLCVLVLIFCVSIGTFIAMYNHIYKERKVMKKIYLYFYFPILKTIYKQARKSK